VRIAASFVLVSSGAVVYLSLSLLLLPWRPLRIRIGNVYGKTVAPPVAWILGVRTRVRHRERLAESRPAIYVTNHTSTLDVLIAMWLCPVGGCGIAKKEIARIPFFGWAYWLSGHLLIDRGDREGAIAALAATAEFVRRHRLSIWIWPEGTRSRNGRLLPFRKGFAHLAIACLRTQGLAARYISGYLETQAPPGQQKLQGADASHAWFAVYDPDVDWLDFDPTNNKIPMHQHITTAWGRDYADITPLKGIVFGGGKHKARVGVDVERI